MNQKWLVSIVIVVVLVGLVFWASDKEDEDVAGVDTLLSGDGDSREGDGLTAPLDTEEGNQEEGADGATTPNPDTDPTDGGNTSSGPGSYEDYSPEKVAKVEEGQVVLFFHAAWCPTCKTLEQDINANLNDIPSGLSILKLDYDSSTDLKKKYGVTYQHTLVQVDNKGNLVKRWAGSPTLAALVSEVQN